MTVRKMTSYPIPNNCPRCGDVVKWSRGTIPAKESAKTHGADLYQFYISCSKSESQSTRGLHGSCAWAFSALGYFDAGVPHILSKGVKWSPYDGALLANWPMKQGEADKGKQNTALVLTPTDIEATHRLLLALEKIPKEQLREHLDWKDFGTLLGLLSLVRSAAIPAGAPNGLSLRLKKPHQG